MATELNLEQKLADLLDTRNFHPEMLGKDGRPVEDTENAKTFSFDYVSGSGKNYGTMVVILGNDNEMYIMYGDNLGKTIEDPQDREEFFNFQQQLSDLANRNRWTATLTDLSKLRRVQAGIAAIKEGLFEGYYGTRKVSYTGEPTEARLMIKHNRTLGENDARFRYVESIFIETADGERFKLPFTHMTGARAMLEHVRQGGKPYDIRGNHICEMVTELKVLSRFNRAAGSRVMEGVTQQIVEQAQHYYAQLRENLKHLGHGRGYKSYFESWHPLDVQEQESLVEDIKTMFIEQTLDTRIEAALPLLARIQQQGNDMKEADIFESWVNKLVEGTWSLPETPEQVNKLKELMSKELIVGPDATNATEQLYDLVGDDELFDRLSELARRDPRANVWNDTEVMDRLRELGIETEGQEPAGAETDAAEAPASEQQPMAEDKGMTQYNAFKREWRAKHGADAKVPDYDSKEYTSYCYRQNDKKKDVEEGALSRYEKAAEKAKRKGDMFTYHLEMADHFATMADAAESEGRYKDAKMYHAKAEQHQDLVVDAMNSDDDNVREGVAEDFDRMLELAGVVSESRMLDESGETLEHILNRFKFEVKQFEEGGELDSDLYEALFDYYANAGEMPYGTMKARTGDPYEWVTQRLDQELGTGNFAPRMAEADVTATFEADADAVFGEGSGCNHTMEGEYCPEHGLNECGFMESMGGTVAGAVAPVSEVSADTLKRYKTAAIKDVDRDIAKKAAGEISTADYEQKMKKRGQGMAAAQRRLTPHGTRLDLSAHGDSIQKDYDRYRFDEGSNDDPMNYNAAITGSYYESADPLARIKELALRK